MPPWYGERILALGDERAARIALSGPSAPGLLEDLDPVRAGRDRLPSVKEAGKVVNERTTNWSIVPCPTPAWAKLVHPDLDDAEALAKLEEQIMHVLPARRAGPDRRLARARRHARRASRDRLTERRFDALHYEGPGTDLTVGLLPTGTAGRPRASRPSTAIEHMPNLPTEEVFTTPDPARADGHVSSTKPLVLIDGTVVRGLKVRFEGGRAVQVDAETAQDTMRTIIERDEGAARLGEVALVDDEGRIGKLDTVFYDTLLDENAASHIALGQGFPFLVEGDGAAAVNESQIHIDFMIGSSDLSITGVTAEGERVPVLVGGRWQV